MQTNPAVEQNKNIKWSESPWNQSVRKGKGSWRKWFTEEPSLKFRVKDWTSKRRCKWWSWRWWRGWWWTAMCDRWTWRRLCRTPIESLVGSEERPRDGTGKRREGEGGKEKEEKGEGRTEREKDKVLYRNFFLQLPSLPDEDWTFGFRSAYLCIWSHSCSCPLIMTPPTVLDRRYWMNHLCLLPASVNMARSVN